MNETSHPWLARVRGLLAKAESTEFPDEAEALTAKAMELMAKYGIEEALLAASMPQHQTISDRLIAIVPPYISAKQTLMHTLARHLGCRAILLDRKAHLFGYQGDCERLEYLFTSLLVQIYSAMMKAPTPPGEGLRAFRHSWINGFNAAVDGRLREAAQRAEAAASASRVGGPSVALVLANRGEQIDRRLTEEYPRLRFRKVSAGSSRSGYSSGVRAGKLADLGGTRITGGN